MFSFPDLGEFNLVNKLLSHSLELKQITPEKRNWLSVGDDACQIDGWLMTKDLSVEGTHFRLDWAKPEQAVEKHIISNVSDISAMGGRPQFALLGLCLSKKWDSTIVNRVVESFSKGFSKRNIALVGGDTVKGEIGMFSTTLIGRETVGHRLLRSGAKVGDSVYISKPLGKSRAGLWILENHPDDVNRFKDLVDYHLCPSIRENLGEELASTGLINCALDISDGLSSELNHLALSSNVLIEIDGDKIPIDPSVVKMCEFYQLNPLDFIMNSGEEYALLFTTFSKKNIFSKRKPFLKVYEIGTIKEGSSVYMLKNGKKKLVKAEAWSHL